MGAKLTDKNRLSITHPNILKEWNYKKNTIVNPNEISYSSNKKVWWVCLRGHEWEATPNNRTGKGSRCPECSYGISQPEMRLFSELSSVFFAKKRYKIKKVELDIYLPELNIGVEYDGFYWHKSKKNKDSEKNSFFKNLGIQVIRVREKPLTRIEQLDILIEQNTLSKENVDDLMLKIKKISNIKNKKEIDNYVLEKNFVSEDKFLELLSYYPSPNKEESLSFVNPKISEEWDYQKNTPLKPDMISYGSEIEFWWKCSKGHEWKKSPKHRNRSPKCPSCRDTKKRLDLAMPDISARWHPIKNGELKPSDFYINSKKIVWWQCAHGSECQGAIQSRTKGINCDDCPLTNQKERKENRMKNYIKSNDVILVSQNESISIFWNHRKNTHVSPNEITENSYKLENFNKKFEINCKYPVEKRSNFILSRNI